MTEAELQAAARDWLARGLPAIEVQVLQARGSVPRPAGTRMVVGAQAVLGTIGGGHLEWQAIARARQLLAAEGAPQVPPVVQPVVQPLALGPSLGQCCGGALTLQYQRFDAAALAHWPAPRPLFALQLYGAGHVGRAIVRLLEHLPCTVQWIDEREGEFPAAPSAASVQRLCIEPLEAEVAQAAPGAFYLVLTHSHTLDLAITEAILRRGDFGYLGLIGSTSKRASFLRRFRQRGIGDEVLARLTCPIGVAGITGKQPEVIAVAVVAQLLQAASAG